MEFDQIGIAMGEKGESKEMDTLDVDIAERPEYSPRCEGVVQVVINFPEPEARRGVEAISNTDCEFELFTVVTREILQSEFPLRDPLDYLDQGLL